MTFLEENYFLPPSQQGFRKHHSTQTPDTRRQTAITMVIEPWTKLKKEAVITTFDYSVTFDTVGGNVLITKVKKLYTILSCCCQGSILGHLFFLLASADILDTLNHPTPFSKDTMGVAEPWRRRRRRRRSWRWPRLQWLQSGSP